MKYVSESYTLQYDTTCDGEIITAGGLFFKAQYLSSMKSKKKWYWGQKQQKQIICFR